MRIFPPCVCIESPLEIKVYTSHGLASFSFVNSSGNHIDHLILLYKILIQLHDKTDLYFITIANAKSELHSQNFCITLNVNTRSLYLQLDYRSDAEREPRCLLVFFPADQMDIFEMFVFRISTVIAEDC